MCPPQVRMRPNLRQTGFTFIELMITLTIFGLLSTMAVPSLRSFILNNRMSAYTSDLVHSLALARTEAIKRAVPIQVCASSDASTCSDNGDWSQGWIIRTLDGDIIQSLPALNEQSSLNAGAASLTFQANGYLQGTGTQFNLCDDRGTPDAKVIQVNALGRAYQDASLTASCP
ncbi:type IV fimbrial biogenesis protein FimT [Allopseudospirillum japonicum]|uniref:Type II secretion system protein H n=2 Tax=Allopseudospirillum japonicum TaxID=64971 RepID=A0A1H6R516_9GAMM|nr:type IV fimbrial biogenesis protein FimT [Allopseudospirillum japonicum]